MMIPDNHPFKGGPFIMGVLNVTPDSFSDGGQYFDSELAISHGLQLIEDGAYILDIGGESTRPGADVISPKEEIERVIPVIEKLKGRVPWISIDTRNAETMCAALDAGANSINDVSGLTHDSNAMDVIVHNEVPVFLMHMQGSPSTMQKNPIYNNVISDVFESLKARINACKTRRIAPEMIIADPGIGFGKTPEHNLLLLRNIKDFHDLGVPILLGTSRKSFIGAISQGEPPNERLGGSISSALWALSQGVQVFRVHDVKETRQAFDVYEAICAE